MCSCRLHKSVLQLFFSSIHICCFMNAKVVIKHTFMLATNNYYYYHADKQELFILSLAECKSLLGIRWLNDLVCMHKLIISVVMLLYQFSCITGNGYLHWSSLWRSSKCTRNYIILISIEFHPPTNWYLEWCQYNGIWVFIL